MAVVDNSADAFVEGDRRGIPIQHTPTEEWVVALKGILRQSDKKGFANPLAAIVRQHK